MNDHALDQSLPINVPLDRLAAFCRQWQITKLALFGSVLRDDFDSESDVDVLVTFAPTADWSLFDVMDAQEQLSTLVGRKVDLVEREAVEKSRNYIRRNAILANARVLYVA